MTFKLKEDERLDDLGTKGYQIIQNPKKFCFGIDAVLLSGYAKVKKGDSVLDLCTGNGIIPILLEAKSEAAHITGIEIQKESADLAVRSVQYNHLEEKISILNEDIREAGSLFSAASFDVITCNPPYMIGNHGLQNPDEVKAIARHELLCTFDDVARVAAKLLREGGNFYLVHRPFRLVEIMATLTKYNLEPKRMQFVHPYVTKEPNMVLIEAKKGAKSRITIEKPLIVYKAPSEYTDDIYNIYEPPSNQVKEDL